MTRYKRRAILLSTAKSLRARKITTAQALAAAFAVSSLPNAMTLDWFAELVFGLGEAETANMWSSAHHSVCQALDHMAAA